MEKIIHLNRKNYKKEQIIAVNVILPNGEKEDVEPVEGKTCVEQIVEDGIVVGEDPDKLIIQYKGKKVNNETIQKFNGEKLEVSQKLYS